MGIALITNNILSDSGTAVAGLVPTSRTISTTSPLTGGGDLSADRTIAIPAATSAVNGYLTSADWTTFNGKQAAGNYITSLTGEATAVGPGAAAVTLNNASVTGKVLTGVNITGGTVLATDTMLTAFGKLQNQINGLIGSTIYQGVWNATTNTPTLTSSVGTNGYYYIVNVAGSTSLNGITDWKVGDWAIFNGGVWQKVDNTDAVTSVNGFTGAVSLTTDNVAQGTTNLYFANSLARAAISLTVTGASGASTYNNTTGVLNVPTYTLAGLGGQPLATNLTSLSGLTFASTAFVKMTAAGTFALDTTAYGTGSVTSVAALTLGTTGTDLSSSVANGTTTPVITLNVPTASATNRGALSAADWTTFNNKQNALTNPVTGTGTTNYLPKFTGASTIGNSAITDDGTTVTLVSRALSGTSASFSSTLTTTGGTRSIQLVSFASDYNYIRSNGAQLVVGTQDSQDLFIQTNNTTRLTLVGSTGAATFSSSVTANTLALTGGTGGINFTSSTTITNTASSGFTAIYANGGGIYLGGSASTNHLTITSSGNVGIGTTAPSRLLSLSGTAYIDVVLKSTSASGVAGGGTLYFGNSSTDSSGILNYDHGGNYMNFFTAGTERMRITSSGNVLIGTTTDAGYKLDVNGSARFQNLTTITNGDQASSRLVITNTGTGGQSVNLVAGNPNVDQTGFSIAYGNTNFLRFTSAGAATFSSSVTATSFFESSDATIKTLITDNYQAKSIESVVAKLYTKNGKQELGYYAQDVQDILPSAVIKGNDGLLSLSYREVHTAKIARLEKRVAELEQQLNLN